MPYDRPPHQPRQTRHRTQSHRTNAQVIRSSARWQRTQRRVLAASPLCWSCDQQGRTTAAQQVHHIQQLAQHPELAFDHDNLVPLCKPCHAIVNTMERNGQTMQAIELFADYEAPQQDMEVQPEPPVIEDGELVLISKSYQIKEIETGGGGG